MQQDAESTNFVLQNILVIAVVGLAIFGYLVLLIRKRWKQNFLHTPDDKQKEK